MFICLISLNKKDHWTYRESIYLHVKPVMLTLTPEQLLDYRYSGAKQDESAELFFGMKKERSKKENECSENDVTKGLNICLQRFKDFFFNNRKVRNSYKNEQCASNTEWNNFELIANC